MKKALTKTIGKITGMHPGICGDVSGIRGDVSGITGDVSGLRGDVDACEITAEERTNGVSISYLVAD